MFVLRDAKFLSFAGTTVTSTITAVTSLAKTCVQTCSINVFNQLPACTMSQRKKKRAIIVDSLSFMSDDISASKVKRYELCLYFTAYRSIKAKVMFFLKGL